MKVYFGGENGKKVRREGEWRERKNKNKCMEGWEVTREVGEKGRDRSKVMRDIFGVEMGNK